MVIILKIINVSGIPITFLGTVEERKWKKEWLSFLFPGICGWRRRIRSISKTILRNKNIGK